MSFRPLLSSILPFPVDLPDLPEAESPAQLSDPGLAEALLQPVAEAAMEQGASRRWAWAYAVLVAEVVTGWAVGPGVEREALELEQAAARATSPLGIVVPRLYAAPDWATLEAQAEDVAHFLEAAWLEARRRSRGEGPRWLTVQEAAREMGVHPEHLRRLLRQGQLPAWGVRKAGRAWLISEDALLGRRRRGRA